MSTQVLIAHTGQRLQVDVAQFPTLDEFKAWVSKQSSIPTQLIVILSSQGRSIKVQSMYIEKEIYVYDIRITQATSPNSLPQSTDSPIPKRYAVPAAPNAIENISSMSSWRTLYDGRRRWAERVVTDCADMAEATRERYGEIDVIIKCLDAAITNLEHSVKQIEPKYQELQDWVRPALSEHEQLAKKWEQYLAIARSIPISAAMVKFMTGKDVKKPRTATLEDLIDVDTARKFGRLAAVSLRKFSEKATELETTSAKMHKELESLGQAFEQLINRSVLGHHSDASQLYDDLQPLAQKFKTDYEMTLEYTDSQRDVLQASKTAATHTERLIPSLKKRAKEMDDILHYATTSRNIIAADSAEYMRNINHITTLHTSVRSQISGLNSADEDLNTFDYLRLIHQLPYMYASFVVEAIRRREWFEKAKIDSTTLANEMALFQEEEMKRRRKWHKTVGNTYGPETVDNKTASLEVNLRGDEDPWPTFTRQDLDHFLEDLQKHKADPGVISDVNKLITDLLNPTKQQAKRVKAFKNGSVHEAGLGRSGLLIRGDNEVIRTLQDQNSTLESKLKTSNSRIKRLEDILHRQSQASRPALANIFQNASQQVTDRPDSVLSVGSPRLGDDRRKSADGTDMLLHKIKQLEDELAMEKEKSAIYEKDLNTRTTEHANIKGQMEEVIFTKKNLLENMEAQKIEFSAERKSLEDEIKALKARLEDTEDEIEHFGESRENEKATYDEKLRTLELQHEQLIKERKDESLRAQGQVDFLRNEAKLQREMNEFLEKQLQTATEEAKDLAKKLDRSDAIAKIQNQALGEFHVQFAPNESVPEDLGDLLEALATRTTGAIARMQAMESDLNILRSDLELEHGTAKDLKKELGATREKLSSEEASTMRLREIVSQEKAKVAALEGELSEARTQLDDLRAKIADGETGSESLRKRLDDEEKKMQTMAEDLAAKQSQVGSVEEELRLFKDRLEETQSRLAGLTGRFDARGERAKDLTQRLYSQNDRLCRLLERLGYAVTRQGSNMTITKLSRAERSSQNANDLSDPGSSVRRSGTLSVTLNSRPLADSADLDLLHWMNAADDAAETEKFTSFVTQLGSFDVDSFTDTVYRRQKDIEHMARKLQRDVKAYREKAHSLQKEAHEKIAFKNFKEGDLALFLPTRNQSAGAWAAFNVGFPHYFLREQDVHRLRSREWLVARISRIREKVVDLSKSLTQPAADMESANDEENDNPFQLSDGLRWYLLDAHEDKPGAPSTPGLGKSTVAANTVEAVADMRVSGGNGGRGGTGKDKGRAGPSSIEGVSKTLSKSLESRRSSSGSKKALPFAIGGGKIHLNSSALASETNSLRAAPPETPLATSPAAHGGAIPSSPVAKQQPREINASREAEASSGQPATATAGTAGQSAAGPAESMVPHKSPEARPTRLQRETSAASVESPVKKSVVWDALWSLDLSYESPGRKKKEKADS